MELVDYEIELLRHIGGEENPSLQWGGAMGQAIECLRGRGLITGSAGYTRLTETGEAWLAEHPKEPSEVDFSGCEAIGVGGYHSEHYGDPDDGLCQWCGLRWKVETP